MNRDEKRLSVIRSMQSRHSSSNNSPLFGGAVASLVPMPAMPCKWIAGAPGITLGANFAASACKSCMERRHSTRRVHIWRFEIYGTIYAQICWPMKTWWKSVQSLFLYIEYFMWSAFAVWFKSCQHGCIVGPRHIMAKLNEHLYCSHSIHQCWTDSQLRLKPAVLRVGSLRKARLDVLHCCLKWSLIWSSFTWKFYVF
jgi:hypothetical protein